ncbi:MAG: hypothetical protein EA361_02195 [Bacteroidetes bacterium]|nr:MAG: hypothetical protein EA361_02195 [Bacteroidota bacterium]
MKRSGTGMPSVLGAAGMIILLLLLWQDAVCAQPSWVRQTPVDKDYYIGIGTSPKTAGSAQHIAIARDMAMEQIASGIAITITAETSQHVLEQSGIIRETFEYNISSRVKRELEGYELVDLWENNEEYWVYYRLSKTSYRMMLDNRKGVAALQASKYREQAERALAREEIASALGYYLRAFREIAPYRGMALRDPDSRTNPHLDVTVYSGLSNILSSMRIHANPSVVIGKLFLGAEEPITLSVSFLAAEGDTIPVNNLPVRLTTQTGDCRFVPPLPTNNEGNTSLTITRVNSPSNVHLKVIPDLAALAGLEPVESEQSLFTGLNSPAAIATVELQPLRILIVASEYNLDQPDRRIVVTRTLSQQLMSAGWSLVSSAMDADYLLYINASTRAGTERQGIHTAFASGSIELSDVYSMDAIFSKNIAEVNAGGSDYTLAGEKALERLAEKLLEELQGTLWE